MTRTTGRNRLMKGAAAALGLAALIASPAAPAQDAAGDEQPWIILEFAVGEEDTPAIMTFNNPSAPDMTLEECKQALPQLMDALLQTAYEARPELKTEGEFVDLRCVMSAEDPLQPVDEDGGGSSGQ